MRRLEQALEVLRGLADTQTTRPGEYGATIADIPPPETGVRLEVRLASHMDVSVGTGGGYLADLVRMGMLEGAAHKHRAPRWIVMNGRLRLLGPQPAPSIAARRTAAERNQGGRFNPSTMGQVLAVLRGMVDPQTTRNQGGRRVADIVLHGQASLASRVVKIGAARLSQGSVASILQELVKEGWLEAGKSGGRRPATRWVMLDGQYR